MRSPQRMMTWQAVQSEVLSRIRSGYWRPGQLIPTESELAVEFSCARATVNRALTSLASSGLLERRRKVGTRIAKHPPQSSTLPKNFVRGEIDAKGATHGYLMVDVARVLPPPDVAQLLMLKSGQEVLLVRAEFSADDRPYCGEEMWINLEAVPSAEEASFVSVPAQEWLAENAALNHGNLSVSATSVRTEFVSNALSLQRGAPVLVIERTSWADAAAVVVSRQYFPEGHTLSTLF